MQNPLYPHPIDDKCPYCGSENVENGDGIFTAEGGTVKVVCRDCGKSHYLKYRVASVMLENDEPGNLTEYHAGYELPDMGADDENRADRLLVAAVSASDGICIMAQGYGDGGSATGFGCPVIIEFYNGQLRVVAWDDIDNDDAGPVIDLGGARESEADPNMLSDHPYSACVLTPNGVKIEEHIFPDVHGAIKWAEKQKPPWEHIIEVRTRKTGALHHRIVPTKLNDD